MTPAVRREHDAEETGECRERAVRALLQGNARVLARPFHSSGKGDRIGHWFLLATAFFWAGTVLPDGVRVIQGGLREESRIPRGTRRGGPGGTGPSPLH